MTNSGHKTLRILIFLGLFTNLTARTQDNSGVTFTSRTDLVLVPVVVTDKSGKHIDGLTQKDFQIQEDGKSKSVVMADETKTFTGRVARTKPESGVYTNALTNDSSPKRLTIFALDLVNTPFLDQDYAREQLIKYLSRRVSAQEPCALLAIRGSGLSVLHDFTSDPAVLVAALKKTTGEVSSIQGASPNEVAAGVNLQLAASDQAFNPDEINGESNRLSRFIGGLGPDAQIEVMKRARAIEVTLQAFQQIAEAFAGVPGRKSLVWATAAFPFGLDAASGALISPRQYLDGGLINAPLFGDRRQGGGLPSFPSITEVLNNSELTRLQPLYERTLQMLNDASISIYPVDARGLVVFFPGADVSRIEGLVSYNSTLFEGSRDTMENLAVLTGGKAFYNRNDLDIAFEKATDDSASYYMVGYYLDKNTKPGWHKLHVKVVNSGSEVRARTGFFVTAEAKQADTRRADVTLALISPLDYTGLPVSVHWMGSKADHDKKRIHFEIDLPPTSNVVDAAKNGQLDMEVVASARSPIGKPVDQFSQHVQANLKPDALKEWQKTGLNYNNDLIVPAGEYSVRFVVRDNLTGRLGSVTAPLQVSP